MKNWCLFCATSLPACSSPTLDNEDFHKKLFVLHKLLQLPLQSSCKLLFSSGGMELCPSCQGIWEEGRDIVEEVERLQLKLQTLQATVQNMVLSYEVEDEKEPSALFRAAVREEINKNLNLSALQTNFSGLGRSVDELEPEEGTTTINFCPNEEESSRASSRLGQIGDFSPLPPGSQPPTPSTTPLKTQLIKDEDVIFLDEVSQSSSSSASSSSGQAKRRRLENNEDVHLLSQQQSFPTVAAALASPSSSNANTTVQNPNLHLNAIYLSQPFSDSHQIVWGGQMEWDIKLNRFGGKRKGFVTCRVISPMQCQVPVVTCTGWPSILILQLIQKKALSFLSPTIFDDAKFVQLQLESGEATSNLVTMMKSGFAGCIVFPGPLPSLPKFNFIVVSYNLKKHAFVGIIAKDQDRIVEEMKAIVDQQARIRAKYPRLYEQAYLQAQQKTNSALAEARGSSVTPPVAAISPRPQSLVEVVRSVLHEARAQQKQVQIVVQPR